jgi:hypothetical protein
MLAHRCGAEIHLEVCQTAKGEFLLLEEAARSFAVFHREEIYNAS